MKITIINNRYGNTAVGGAETVIHASVLAYEQAGHQVRVITTRPYFKPEPVRSVEKIIYLPSLYYFFVKLPKPFRIVWHALDLVNVVSFFRVAKLLWTEKPDLILTHNLKGVGLLLLVLPGFFGVKHQHFLHDIQLLHPSGLLLYGRENILDTAVARIFQRFNQIYFRSNIEIFSPSQWLLDLHTRRGFFANNHRVLKPNPLTFTLSAVPLARNNLVYIFLYVGQIEEHKGIACLLAAYQQFRDVNPGASCLLKIVGNGSRRSYYQAQCRQDEAIHFLGRQRASAVKRLMQEANCLLVPSLCYENAPTVIFEALSMALPVIASRLGGNIEALRSLGGVLFTPGQADDLARKMLWAKKNPEMIFEMARQAQAKLKQRDSLTT